MASMNVIKYICIVDSNKLGNQLYGHDNGIIHWENDDKNLISKFNIGEKSPDYLPDYICYDLTNIDNYNSYNKSINIIMKKVKLLFKNESFIENKCTVIRTVHKVSLFNENENMNYSVKVYSEYHVTIEV
jgi:hypothetical protein